MWKTKLRLVWTHNHPFFRSVRLYENYSVPSKVLAIGDVSSCPQGPGLGLDPIELANGLVWHGQISLSVKLWILGCLSRKARLLPFYPSNPTPGFLSHDGGFVYHSCSQLIPIKEPTNNLRVSKESLGYDPFWDFFSNVCERKPGRNTRSWFTWLLALWFLEKSLSFSEHLMRHHSFCSTLLMAWLLMCLEKCQAQKKREPVITACAFCCLETEL